MQVQTIIIIITAPTLTLSIGGCVTGAESLEAYHQVSGSGTTDAEGEPGSSEASGSTSAAAGSDGSGGVTTDTGALPDEPSGDADAPIEILDFTVEPAVVNAAGPVNISAAFSPGVTSAVLFEKHDDETRVLEILDPVSDLAHEYAVTSGSFNGTHDVYLQAFDDEGEIVQATSAFDVELPEGGTPIWHHVDYDPDDPALFAYGADVAAHGDGVVLVGVRSVNLDFRLVVRRYTANNEIDWEFETSDEVAGIGVAVDADGNVIVVGEKYSAHPQMWVHKLDANGVPVWNEARVGMPDTSGLDVATNEDGQIYVAGTRTVFDGNEPFQEDDAAVWEFSPDGAMEGWAWYDNNESYAWGDDRANGVAVLADGRVFVAGETTTADGNNWKVSQAVVLEYSQDVFSVRWTSNDGQWGASSAYSVVEDDDGVVVAGWTQDSELEPRRLDTRRVDASFATSWVYPGFPEANRVGEAFAVARDPEGRFVVGASVEGDGSQDAHVFVAKQHGTPAWFPPFTYNGAESADEYVYGVATNRFGYVYYTGVERVDGTMRIMLGKLHP